jgi:hypothetical protein
MKEMGSQEKESGGRARQGSNVGTVVRALDARWCCSPLGQPDSMH